MNLARSNPKIENRELVEKVSDQTTLDEPLAERSAQTSGDGAFDVRVEERVLAERGGDGDAAGLRMRSVRRASRRLNDSSPWR